MSSEVLLQMSHINKSFPGVKALDDAQLTVKKGEVHALIGENGAGKSTLMKILLGIYQADSGEMVYKGQPVHFKTPHEALTAGISMIHQEISLIPSMDVSENIWIGREARFRRGPLISKKKRLAATGDLLRHLRINADPQKTVRTLSVANMQLVELARAVSYNADIIIMDEPTSSLTNLEVGILYDVIRELSEGGTAIIFISHKLEEIFEICSHVTVMRDGKYISSHGTKDISQDDLITKIAGREIKDLYPKECVEVGAPVLQVHNFASARVFDDISFEVKKGEILGFYGLVGAGRTEIIRAVFGIDKYDTGTVTLDGAAVHIKSPEDALGLGMAMVTEDRLHMGIVPNLTVCQNISLAYLSTIARVGFIDNRTEQADAQDMVEKLDVRTPSLKTRIGALSGGNQQKAILARWLLTSPKVLILDEPTRGIDVSSKSEIHRLISSLAQRGLAVIMISSELPEILGMSDRIIVIREGAIAATVMREDATQEVILAHAFGTATPE